jgi:cell division protein ZapA (FtsZ GTPase activity inhibitor)
LAQRVRRDPYLDPSLACVAADEVLDHLDAEPAAVPGEKESTLARVAHELAARLGEVRLESHDGTTDDGDKAVLLALAVADQDLSLAEVEVAQVEPLALGDAQRASVERLEDRPVAFPERRP